MEGDLPFVAPPPEPLAQVYLAEGVDVDERVVMDVLEEGYKNTLTDRVVCQMCYDQAWLLNANKRLLDVPKKPNDDDGT